MKIQNCGLVALEKMANLSNISMFTLIHLAKDNGINLYFCKVNDSELVKVERPAIFHQENHFVFVDNGKPLPTGKYTGYVLTTKPLNEPLPFSLAKKIQGGSIFSSLGSAIGRGVSAVKNFASNVGHSVANVASRVAAPVVRTTSNIIRGISSAVRPIVSAARTATSSVSRATAPAIHAMASAPSTALRYVGTAAPSSSSVFNAARMAAGGLGQAASNVASNIGKGISNFASPIANSVYNGANMLSGAVQNATHLAGGGGNIQSTGGGFSVTGAPSKSIPSFSNTYSTGLPGSASAASFAGGSLPGQVQSMETANNYDPRPSTFYGTMGDYANNQANSGDASNPFSFTQSMSPSGVASGGGGRGSGNSNQDGGGGGSSNPYANFDATGLQSDSMKNYTTASNFLGYGGLPSATRDDLNKYATMSLDDLTKQFSQGNDQASRQLEEKHQQERNALMTQYANYGQDPMTSSDAQNKLTQLDRQYAQAQSELTQQATNAAQDKAIQFKKEMLSQSMSQGQFDYKAAMDLAKNVGMDQQLNYALQSKNPEVLQNVLAAIFSKGR